MTRPGHVFVAAVAILVASATAAAADTTDVQWQDRVVIEKQGAHCVDDPNCFNRYHPAIPAKARARPGDMIVFHTRDALDSDLTLDSNADDLAAVDLNLVHPMTGPVHIEGAERGDVPVHDLRRPRGPARRRVIPRGPLNFRAFCPAAGLD
jgi:formamidase